MRRRRRPKAPANLEDLTYAELVRLAQRGAITFKRVHEITHQRVLDVNGGIDPYGYLRDTWDGEL